MACRVGPFQTSVRFICIGSSCLSDLPLLRSPARGWEGHMPLIPTLRYIAVDKHFTFFYKKFRLQHVPGVSTLKYFTKEKLLHSNTCHESLLLVSFVLTKTITLLQVPFSQLQHCKYDCYNWTINFYFWVFCYGQKIISLLQVHHCCTKCMYTEYFALLHMSLILISAA